MDSKKVVILDCDTTLDIPPDRVLDSAKDMLDCVVLIGTDKDNNFFFSSSISSVGDMLFLIEKFKKYILEHDDL